MTFEEVVLEILEVNLGGLKLGKLIAELISYHEEEFTSPSVLTGRIIVEKLEKMETIGLLKYPYSLNKDIIREKTFVHLPIPVTIFKCPACGGNVKQ